MGDIVKEVLCEKVEDIRSVSDRMMACWSLKRVWCG